MARQRWSWREEGVVEGALMRAVFIVLLGAAGLILWLDLRDLIGRAEGEGSEQTMRIVLQPPTRTDQERPYFPKALPVLPNSEPPRMPGISGRPTPEMTAARMSFHLGPGGDLSAIGRIEQGTAEDFQKFLDDNGRDAKTIVLLSPGGSVADAMAMGRAIRKRGLDTRVPDEGYCASSCPLVFAAGVDRRAGQRALVGVHQIYAVPQGIETWEDGISTAQRVSAECGDYLTEMGVDAALWLKAMQTPKEKLYIFRPDELSTFKLTTTAPSSPTKT
jgi:hypothetical protein